ncbi:MAG: SRPBCC family protein [Saprospiraceae bacterium]
MKNILKKIGIVTLISLPIIVIVAFLASPFKTHKGFDYPLIKQTIIIDASVEEVFSYLGNSDNARDWSVFVDHIRAINGDEVLDGEVGSIRRCFVRANEKGILWDERITEVVLGKKRQLTVDNLENFPITAQNLATEQLYKRVNENQCELSFTLFYKNAEPTWGEYFKTTFAAYLIKSIFKKNMKNIKKIVESTK